MFNSKSKTTSSDTPVGGTTIIGAGTVINGDIESTGDIRIDGTLNGNINSKAKVLIGADGVIEGVIKAKNVDVLGKITGQLQVQELLQLRGKCNMDGDVYTGKLEMEPSAVFNGRVHMGANVVELNFEVATAVNQ